MTKFSAKPEFQYDVAFSFLKDDLALALEINDLIQDRFSTFVYSQKQEQLAGENGVQKFSEVFGKDSRVVVILYREGWGDTPGTRPEKMAIQNRSTEEGDDFSIFVQLDSDAKMPVWVNKLKIYYDLNIYPLAGLAAVIARMVQESGGESRPETIDDKVARAERRVGLKRKKNAFLRRENAVEDATAEFERLVTYLKKKEEQLSSFSNGSEYDPEYKFIIKGLGYRLQFYWIRLYPNLLEGSRLEVELLGLKREARLGRNRPFDYKDSDYGEKEKQIYSFDFNPTTEAIGWSVHDDGEEVISSIKLADEWLSKFIDVVSNAH